MIIGALLQQQERDRGVSVHCQSPLANIQIFSIDESMGIAKSIRPAYNRIKSNDSNNIENINNDSLTEMSPNQMLTEDDKIISILMKPRSQRNFQEMQFLYQELEKVEYLSVIRQRCKDKRYREAINVLSHRFVKKGDFILKKNEIGTEFFIILSGACLVLDDDESYQKASSSLPQSEVTPSPKNQTPQSIRISQFFNTATPHAGYSNFRQAMQSWDENCTIDGDDDEIIEEEGQGEETKITQKEFKQQMQPASFQKLSSQNSFKVSLLKSQSTMRKQSFMHQLFKSSLPQLKILKLLNKGDSFGETAIQSIFQKRTAYIQAKEDCHLMYMDKSDYLKIIGTKKAQQIERISTFLSGFKFVEGWQQSDLKALSGHFFIDKFSRGEYIFKEGDISQNIYIVKKGEVCVMKEVKFQLPQVENLEESRFRNQQRIIEIAQLSEGEIFGEESSIQYESKRCFSIQVKSMKARILRINANQIYDRLWDPNSKKIFLSQVNQKLKWRSDRFNQLVQLHLETIMVKEEKEDKPYQLVPEIQKRIDTPDKIMLLDKKYLSSNSTKQTKQQKLKNKNENIVLINRGDNSISSLAKHDLKLKKEDYLKKFPIAWHLRQQELVLKEGSISSSQRRKISDSVQKLQPCIGKIEEKRNEIFNQRIKSGTLQYNQSNQQQEQEYLNASSQNASNLNTTTLQLKRVQSANLNISRSNSINLSSIPNSPKSRKNQFTEELNQIFSVNAQNFSKFHPQSTKNSVQRIPYVELIDETSKGKQININNQEFEQPNFRQKHHKLSQLNSNEEQKSQKIFRQTSQSFFQRQSTLNENEIIEKQKQYFEEKSSQLRGFSASLKKQFFFHSMSVEEESGENRVLFLRKYLEEKQQQVLITKRKSSSIDYLFDSMTAKKESKMVKSQSNQNLNSAILSQRSEKNNSKKIFIKIKANNTDQFSLFEDEYSKYSKEEQERLRNQEKRFNQGLDKNLSIHTSIIEKDMMEALSMKGQQISNDINLNVKSENESYILNLFLKKDKFTMNSVRLQRTNNYSSLVKQKGQEQQFIQDKIASLQNQTTQQEQGFNSDENIDDSPFNFTNSNESAKNSPINQAFNARKQSFPEKQFKDVISKSSQNSSVQNSRIFGKLQQQSTPTNNQKKNIQQIDQINQVSSRQLSSRPQTAGQKQSLLTLKESLSNRLLTTNNYNLKKILSNRNNNSRTLSKIYKHQINIIIINFYICYGKAKHNSEIDAQEEHKMMINNQVKQPKKQTNAFELINKLIFENKPEKMSKNNLNGQIEYQKSQRPQSTSVYDPKLKQLLIKRNSYYKIQ